MYQFVDMFAVFVGEDFVVVLEDGDDESDGLDGHVVLFVESHGDYAVLELVGEELEFSFELLVGVQGLEGLKATETHFTDLPNRKGPLFLVFRVTIRKYLVSKKIGTFSFVSSSRIYNHFQ